MCTEDNNIAVKAKVIIYERDFEKIIVEEIIMEAKQRTVLLLKKEKGKS
jgi:hypothetical protein